MAIIDTSRVNPLVKNNEKNWLFYMDSYKGGPHYIKPWRTVSEYEDVEETTNSYLYPHEHELKIIGKFRRRHRRSFYPNYCRLPVNTFTKYIFSGRSDITREFESDDNNPNYSTYIEDIDLRGTHINQLVKKATTIQLITGLSYILIDKQPVPEGIITAQQQQESGIRAYANVLTPELVRDWSTDQYGNYNWVLIRSDWRFDEDFTADPDQTCIYYLWTKENIFILDSEGELLLSELFPINPLPNDLGFIPLIPCVYTDIDIDDEPESMLADIAKINREIYNAYSLYQEELYKVAFAQLMKPQSKDDFSETSEKDMIDYISNSIVLEYPEGSAPPAYLTPPVAALIEKRAYINELIIKILQLSNLEKQEGVSGASQLSGIAMAMSFNDTYYTISQMASKVEKIERQIWEHIQAYDNELLVGDISVEYPTDFDIKTDQLYHEWYEKLKMNVEMSPTAHVQADLDFLKTQYKNVENKELSIIEDELKQIYDKQFQRNISGESEAPVLL